MVKIFVKLPNALTAIIVFFILYQGVIYSYKEYFWYYDFFQSLKKEEIKSARLFQVWVSPFQDGRPVAYVGGDQKHFETWKKSIESLCSTAEYFEKDIHFVYEIIVDQKVYDKHEDLIRAWSNRFGDRIVWTNINELVFENSEPIQNGLAQCYTGCASVCSDFLRFTQIGLKEYERDFYMDIDLITESYANRYKLSSADVLGSHIKAPGIYHTFQYRNNRVECNCDLLITQKLPESLQKKIYSDMLSVLDEYGPLYQHMASQYKREAQPNLASYLQNVQPLIDWFREHPDKNYNQYGLILDGIGPGFWSTQLQKGHSLPYRYGFTENFDNYFSWRDSQAYLPYRGQTYNLFSERYDKKTAEHLMMLNIYLYDYIVFSKKTNHPWSQDLKKHCIALWDEVAPLMTLPFLYGDQKIGIMIEQMRMDVI